MPDNQPSTDDRSDRGPSHDELRRRMIAIFGGAGLTMLAGCTSSADLGGAGSSSGGYGGSGGDSAVSGETGTFRLLISDQPVAIDEFDSLTVTFDRARVFRGGGNEDGEAVEENEAAAEAESTDTETPDETAEPTTATETDEPVASAADNGGNGDDENDDEDGDGNASYSVIALDGASVDLTQVLGTKAMGVFDGELPAGRYTKIELYASDVEGIVDGAGVDVTIPSGKLQIIKPFEVEAGGTLEFVFDITVVKKGSNGYNLLPVIGESGVAGQDVPVEIVEDRTDVGRKVQ